MSVYNKLIEERNSLIVKLETVEAKLKKIDKSLVRYYRPIGNYKCTITTSKENTKI